MANEATIHVSDAGTLLTFTVVDEDSVVVDVSSATTKTLTLRKPTGATLSKTLSFLTDGTDGKLTYATTKSGTPAVYDIDTAGIWTAQLYLVLATGEWRSTVIDFVVKENA